MATPRNIIGPRLRKLRSQKGLSQQELAALLQRGGWDVSRGIIARIEGQVRWVADFELVVLSEALGETALSFLSERGTSKAAARLAHELQRGGD